MADSNFFSNPSSEIVLPSRMSLRDPSMILRNWGLLLKASDSGSWFGVENGEGSGFLLVHDLVVCQFQVVNSCFAPSSWSALDPPATTSGAIKKSTHRFACVVRTVRGSGWVRRTLRQCGLTRTLRWPTCSPSVVTERGCTATSVARWIVFTIGIGVPFIPPNQKWQAYNDQALKQEPVTLDGGQRRSVERAIRETCELREWLLQAVNVRTNHVHVVASTGDTQPGAALNAFKANATRQMRQAAGGLTRPAPGQPEAARGICGTSGAFRARSTYVINGQGGAVPD